MKTGQENDLPQADGGRPSTRRGPADGQVPGADGIYLYGFARAPATRDIVCEGIDSPGRVAVIESGEVAAIFSAVSLEGFTGDASAVRLQDPDWIVPRVYRHEQVLKQVMARSPVLPVRFGAVFSTLEGLQKLLAQKAAEISRFLGQVEGKEEWIVQGFLNLAKTRDRLLSLDPEFLLKRQSLAGSPGSRYLQEKRLQGEADRRLREYRLVIAGAVREELAPCALEERLLRLRHGTSESGDAMILHCAFLVERPSVADFLARLREPQIARADGMRLRSSGPWPPYDFCPSIAGADS